MKEYELQKLVEIQENLVRVLEILGVFEEKLAELEKNMEIIMLFIQERTAYQEDVDSAIMRTMGG